MAVDVPGLISVLIFYALILVLGIYAGRKTSQNTSQLFVAGRSMGAFLAFFTISATAVGGGFINGTAEVMAWHGIVWTQAPIGYTIGIIIGGLFYAPKMRNANYVTMFDPFQEKYGKGIGATFLLPEFMGDLFWTAATLNALGTSMSIILDISDTIAIIVSSSVAVFYTFLGGLYSVAYTDVIQFFFIIVGLVVSVPFAYHHPAVNLSSVGDSWQGSVPTHMIGVYLDTYLLLVLGGFAWQAYFQRVLACRTAKMARWISLLAAVLCLFVCIPPAIAGVVGAATDWNQTTYTGEIPLPEDKRSHILPLVLEYLCPLAVSMIGFGAVSAAVMSSADSALLAIGTSFAHNLYKQIIRPQASDREVRWVMRISIVASGILATVLAITSKTVYGLFVICADLIYVVMFPQLTCTLWFKSVNSYGCLSGYLISLILRIGGGEPFLGLPVSIKYPFYSEEYGQLFPFKTLSMLVNFIGIVSFSLLARFLFTRKIVPLRFDVLHCVEVSSDKKAGMKERQLAPGEDAGEDLLKTSTM